MKIHGMLLIRNEASRLINDRHIFGEVLLSMYNLCDRLVIIDDNSSDNTIEYIKNLCLLDERVELIQNNEQKWNVNELEVRKQLWELTTRKADNNDWIICLDADELLLEGFRPYLKYLFESTSKQIDAIGFRLHDMWSNTHYRFDDYWLAHLNYWPLAIRYKENKKYIWNEKPLHCGRFPCNAGERMLQTQIPIQHFGWADEKDREAKYKRYMDIDQDGEHGSMGQYKSILDQKPNLVEFGRCCIND